VQIDTNTACTGTNFIFTAAYLGSFDPENICTNWIGDSGSSPNPEQAFDVDVDNGQTLVIVVSEVTTDAGCPAYTLTVTGLCQSNTPTPTPTGTPTATPTPTPAQIMLRAHERRVGPNRELVELRWIGANSARVDIFRNGAQIARVQNTGSYADVVSRSGFFRYKVCEAGTQTCSNPAGVTFER